MKIINEFHTYTASGNAASGFPLTNLAKIDTNLIWKGIATSETISFDLGAAKAVNSVFLNNANFTSATIILSNNSDFSSGETKSFTLADDDLGIKRAFCVFDGGNYRYIRVVCSGSSNAISLGNVIIGQSKPIYVSSWEVSIEDNLSQFQSDGGAYREKRKGQSRHSFSCTWNGTKAEIDALKLNGPSAVIYTDLDDVADSYIVGFVRSRRKSVEHIGKVSISMTLNEII